MRTGVWKEDNPEVASRLYNIAEGHLAVSGSQCKVCTAVSWLDMYRGHSVVFVSLPALPLPITWRKALESFMQSN